MANASASPLVQYVRKIVSLPDDREASDSQLLQRFVVSRDESAFAGLVSRHGPMVFGVCQRLLHHSQDAEDAFQATFLVLVRKAGAIARRELLGNWLYGVASRVAAKARTQAGRRRLREQPLPDAGEGPEDDRSGDHIWSDLRSVLDEEILRLPMKYRAAFVLCYIEGKTNDEAARLLHCPTGTVQSRLAWARERLRSRLTRRGLALSAGLSAAALAGQIADAATARVPGSLRDATLKAALQFARGKAAAGGAISAPVAALTRGMLKTMLISKLKFPAVILLAIVLVSAGAGSLMVHAPDPAPASPRDDEQPKPAVKKAKKRETGSQQVTAREEVVKTFATGRAPRVIVELFNGGITVTARSEEGVKVDVLKEGRGENQERAQEALKNIEVTMNSADDKDAVYVKARLIDQEKHTASGASAEIRVPIAAVLELRTSNGPITVTGGSGKTALATSNGPVQVKEHKGPIQVKTSNGRIRVEGADGALNLHTSNGAVDIKAEQAALDVRTSNGSIHFNGKLADGKHVLHSSNGSVVLSLPAGARFAVNATTSHGGIHSDFEMRGGGSSGKHHLQGSVGEDPPASLELHTSNGSIELHKSK